MFTIQGIDNEFAASTGSNVNTTENSSTLDNPPDGSKDLLITTQEGDPDPRSFDIGDTYDISWGGQGGGGTILNAVVIRSDQAPDGEGGVIVFEGTDENGDPAQIIWTPGFDLEGWYQENYNPSAEPQFYTEDTQPAYSHTYVCFASGTLIKTPGGTASAGSLSAGDLVTTQDSGDVAILWTGQRLCSATDSNAPVVFQPGSIGNTRTLRLSQQHRVLIRSPLTQFYFGCDEVLVPAKACVNGHSIRIVPASRIFYVHLLLPDHHILQAEGARCESLLPADQTIKNLYNDTSFQALGAAAKQCIAQQSAARPVLKMQEAHFLMRAIADQTAARHHQIAV